MIEGTEKWVQQIERRVAETAAHEQPPLSLISWAQPPYFALCDQAEDPQEKVSHGLNYASPIRPLVRSLYLAMPWRQVRPFLEEVFREVGPLVPVPDLPEDVD